MNEVKITRTGEDYALQALMSEEVTRRVRRHVRSAVFWGVVSAMVVLLVVGGAVGGGVAFYLTHRVASAVGAVAAVVRDEENADALRDQVREFCDVNRLDEPDDLISLSADQIRARYGKQVDEYQKRKRAIKSLEVWGELEYDELRKQTDGVPTAVIEAKWKAAYDKYKHRNGKAMLADDQVAAKKIGG